MNQLTKNKEFILEYLKALSGVKKTPELVSRFVVDEELRNHIYFFDSVLPKYELYAEELTAEDNRVVLKARCKGRHDGEFRGIPPTGNAVDFGFAICYTIENNKIVHHWILADLAKLMEQLGVSTLEMV